MVSTNEAHAQALPVYDRARDEWALARFAVVSGVLSGVSPSCIRNPIARAFIASVTECPTLDFESRLTDVAERAGVTEYKVRVEATANEMFVHLSSLSPCRDAEIIAGRIQKDEEYRNTLEAIAAVEASAKRTPATLRRYAELLATLADIEDGDGRSAGPRTLADVLAEGIPEAAPVVRTGLAWWDDAQPEGGMARGSMIVLAGPPGVGKSGLALQLVLSALVADSSLRAVWALGEMTEAALMLRALQCLAGVGRHSLRVRPESLSPGPRIQVEMARETLADIGSRLVLVPAPLTPGAIGRAVRAEDAGLFVGDFLQLMRPDNGAACDTRRAEVDACLFSLRELCNGAGAVGLVVSNMAKPSGGRVDALTAGKESSEIGFATDALYVGEPLDEPQAVASDAAIRWRCLKQRHGEPRDVATIFRRDVQRFGSLAGGAR